MQASLERLRKRREENGESGFTLIELLIVIVILGILAAIVVFAVENLSGQAATASCGSDLKTVQTALEAYKAQTGSYPNNTAGVNALTLSDGSLGPWLKDAVATSAGSSTNSNYYFTYHESGTGFSSTYSLSGVIDGGGTCN